MMYNLIFEGKDEHSGEVLVRRQGIKFTNEVENNAGAGTQGDLIEIRIHRIERRIRVELLQEDFSDVTLNTGRGSNLILADGGPLDPGMPRKRYKYQLLDPADDPFAMFRFYCRTYSYLKAHGIISSPLYGSPCSFISSSEEPEKTLFSDTDISDAASEANLRTTVCTQQGLGHPMSQMDNGDSATEDIESRNEAEPDQCHSKGVSNICGIQREDSSLIVLAKDSIEDIPSSVRRSPKTQRSVQGDKNEAIHRSLTADITPSPSKRPRLRNGVRPGLLINFDRFGHENTISKRPLSPFTSWGMLRKTDTVATTIASPVSPMVHPARDVFEQTEDKDQIQVQEAGNWNLRASTRVERRGRFLRGFCGKQADREASPSQGRSSFPEARRKMG